MRVITQGTHRRHQSNRSLEGGAFKGKGTEHKSYERGGVGNGTETIKCGGQREGRGGEGKEYWERCTNMKNLSSPKCYKWSLNGALPRSQTDRDLESSHREAPPSYRALVTSKPAQLLMLCLHHSCHPQCQPRGHSPQPALTSPVTASFSKAEKVNWAKVHLVYPSEEK